MHKGELVEFGSPSELENKRGGIYSQMMKKYESKYKRA